MEYCKTQRGAEQLLCEGYRYQKNRNGTNGKVFWRCHDRLCTGCVIVQNGSVVKKTEHSHPPLFASNHVEKYIRQTQDKCRTTTDIIPKLYNDILTEIAGTNNHETAIHMPTYPSIKSSLYRARQKKIPHLPRKPEDLTIEGEWAETMTHECFLLRVDGDHNEKIIDLATDSMLQRLSTASTLYMDGTFAVCQRLFYQLFTINIYIDDQQYPVYALLPSKSRAIYNRLFTILKEELQNRQLNLLPPRIPNDFELSLMQSVILHFPLATISGCYFHFHQCLYRWVQTKGHSRLYNEKGTLYDFIRSTAAISFVPIPSVRIAWFAIKTSSPPDCEASNEYIEYFKSTWMTSFPISTCNHFMTTDDRTNNSLEGWHNRLNRLAGRCHPNIWQLLQLLRQEEAVSEVKIVQLQNGGLPNRQSKGWRTLNARIARLKAKFTELSLEEYIQRMSNLTGL